MNNDGENESESLYSPEAFAMAAWGLLTITVEKLKELDPNFDQRAINLFDHLLGRAGADPTILFSAKSRRTGNTRP